MDLDLILKSNLKDESTQSYIYTLNSLKTEIM